MYTHLLIIRDADLGRAEIERLSGRISLRLSRHLVVAQLPQHVDLADLHEAQPMGIGAREALSEHELELARAWLSSHAGASLEGHRGLVATTPEEGLKWTAEGFLAPRSMPLPEREASQGAVDAGAYYLQGAVSVGVVVVSGPDDLSFSSSEVSKVQSEVLDGLAYLSGAEPTADVSFTPTFTTVSITAKNSSSCVSCSTCEQVWMPGALAALGYSSVEAYKSALKAQDGSNWAYVVFFIKYNACWFAYAYFNGYICMQYSNDGWGSSNIHKVFAHESCHIFNAADEYSSDNSKCSCDRTYGYLQVNNGNCASCPDHTQLDCLMDANTYTLCSWSRGQLGWQRWGPQTEVTPINSAKTSSGIGAAALSESVALFAYLGTGGSNLWCYTFDGSTFLSQTEITSKNGAKSSDTPALAQYNGQVYMAYRGSGSGNLYACSTTDGASWSSQTKITSQNGAKSGSGPGLAAYNGKLYMAYRGDSSSNLYVCAFDGSTWGDQTKITSINSAKTSTTPALAVYNNKLYLVYVGEGGSNLWCCSFDGTTWSGQTEITSVNGAKTSAPPALFVFNGFLQVLFKGESSGNLWTCAFDGSKWLDQVKVTEENAALTSKGPGVAVLGSTQATACFRGDSSTSIWSMSLLPARSEPLSGGKDALIGAIWPRS